MPPPRQTVSYLTKRFREVGLYPDPRRGQNFLIDLNLLELLAHSAQINSNDVVLEVGTGTGSLTAMLAEKAAEVVTVEIDKHLFQLASETLIDSTNVTMLLQDVLKNKNNIDAMVLDTVKEKMAQSPGRVFKLAANLPYSIATPLVSNLLLTDITPASMTITIQKELADRMCARPSTKDYSSLSIWIQSLCDVEIVRIMPPSVFWPPPKVHSAIVHIVPRAEKRAKIIGLKFFHTFVRALFFHRRKFLRSVVLSAFKNQLDKPTVDEVLTNLQLGPKARAEQLDVETIRVLCESLRAKLPPEDQFELRF